MKKSEFKNIIREEIKQSLNEEYIDKYKITGILNTNTIQRNQEEILSDIRSLPGVTIVSSREVDDSHQAGKTKQFRVRLSVKVDGFLFIKSGGFNKEKAISVVSDIPKIEGVNNFNFNPEDIEAI